MKAKKTPIAVLTAQLINPDGWQQLLPKGEFRSRDGSPQDVAHWFIDKTIAHRLMDKVRALKQDILIDYDHETIIKAKNGVDAGNVVAAGWFNADEMQWFDDDERAGLFIKPRWTPKAYQQIKDGEFAFLSAVFPYDENGIPLELRMAAVTNDPGVTGMQRLAVLSAYDLTTESNAMNALLKQLLAKLGVELADGAEPTEEQATAAKDALDALIKGKTDAEAQVATLSAKSTSVDLSQYVPKATYDATVSQLAVLSAKTAENEIDTLVTKARNEGRAIEAEVDYLKQFGKQKGVAELSAMLSARPQIAVLSAQQTQTTKVEKTEKGVAVLSAVEKETAYRLGISEADFIKQKAEMEAN
ncbi:phage protease [Mannheimia massilioguelmaensis]|uniref:phage protease n=1 Tax=Mannheimia massilioguelmaensis TaxID=1604354 RepID=UPI0005C8D5C2|nr:phage protease [Mannheimia massilioguelmaensis]